MSLSKETKAPLAPLALLAPLAPLAPVATVAQLAHVANLAHLVPLAGSEQGKEITNKNCEHKLAVVDLVELVVFFCLQSVLQ